MPTTRFILIGAGHGQRPDGTFDNGAFNPHDKILEHDLNVAVSGHCVNALLRHPNYQVDYDVAMFGSAHEPNWQELIKRAKERNKAYSVAVEIHHDSYNAAQAGFAILPKTIAPNVTKLGREIYMAYIRNGLPVKPNYKDVRGLGWLRAAQWCPLIWECNVTMAVPTELLIRRGESIAEGIVTYFGDRWIPKPVPKVITPPTVLSNKPPLRLEAGAKGPEVEQLQRILKIPVTGVWGTVTTNAVMDWKRDHGYFPSPLLDSFHLKELGVTV